MLLRCACSSERADVIDWGLWYWGQFLLGCPHTGGQFRIRTFPESGGPLAGTQLVAGLEGGPNLALQLRFQVRGARFIDVGLNASSGCS